MSSSGASSRSWSYRRSPPSRAFLSAPSRLISIAPSLPFEPAIMPRPRIPYDPPSPSRATLRSHTRRFVAVAGKRLPEPLRRRANAPSGLPPLLCGVEKPARFPHPLSRRLSLIRPARVCTELCSEIVNCASALLSHATALLDRSCRSLCRGAVPAQHASAGGLSVLGNQRSLMRILLNVWIRRHAH